MTTYKLFYFNLKALGEPIRYMFAYADVSYEDIRIQAKDWPSLKQTMPMGQVPLLEINGKRIHQHVSICRFLGKQFGLAGNDDLENVQIDMVIDTITDFRFKLAAVHYETNEQVKGEKSKVLVNQTMPYYLQKLDDLAKENNGHFALNRVTWADVYFVGLLPYLNNMAKKDITADWLNLKKIKESVESKQGIKSWNAIPRKLDCGCP